MPVILSSNVAAPNYPQKAAVMQQNEYLCITSTLVLSRTTGIMMECNCQVLQQVIIVCLAIKY